MNTRTCTHTRSHIHTHSYSHTYTYNGHTHTHTPTHTHTYTHTRTHTYTGTPPHAHTRAHSHPRARTHGLAYTHSHSLCRVLAVGVSGPHILWGHLWGRPAPSLTLCPGVSVLSHLFLSAEECGWRFFHRAVPGTSPAITKGSCLRLARPWTHTGAVA